jgi:hypothetical protein
MMMLTLGLHIRLMRFFWGFKIPQKNLLATNAYTRAPAFTYGVPRNAKKTVFVSCMRLPLILDILGGCHITQIAKRIVGGVTVNMVYVVHWFRASHVHPCQAMRAVGNFVQLDNQIPVRSPKPSYVADSNSTVGFYQPSKNACFRVVTKHFFDLFRRYTNHSYASLKGTRPVYHESLA